MTYCGITLGDNEECLDNLHRRVPVHHMLPEMAAYTRNEREDFQAGHPRAELGILHRAKTTGFRYTWASVRTNVAPTACV